MLRFCSGLETFVLLAVVLLAPLNACGDDDDDAGSLGGSGGMPAPVVDASIATHDAAVDAHVALPTRSCTGELPIMKARDLHMNAELDPDWSCYAAGDADAGDLSDADLDAGGAATRSVRFDFMHPDGASLGALPGVLAGLRVDFYFGPSTLGPAAVSRTFDGSADHVMLDVPTELATLSAIVHAHENAAISAFAVVEVRQYGLRTAPGGSAIEGVLTVRDSRRLGISLALDGGQEDPSKAIIIANIRDCRGLPLSGARFELIDAETNLPVATGTEPGLPRVSYSDLALPTTTCTFTSNQQQDASWMMIDAPINVSGDEKTHAYRLRVEGRMHATDIAPVTIGEREIEMVTGGTTFVRLYR